MDFPIFSPFSVTATPGAWSESESIQQFYESVLGNIRRGIPLEPSQILSEGKRLGISVSDLLLGILNPLLIQMGQYFESGKISVEQEHLFSKTINEVISSLTVESGEGGDGVVLFPADENIHSIGLNFFRFLVIQKVSGCVEVLDRGPRTLDEFVKMIEKRHPKIMGIGFALPTQIDYLRQILHWCDEYKGVCNIPLIMAGGPAASEISSFSDLKGKIFISDAYDTKSAVAYIVRICGSFTRAH